ncbi:hypothetical protein KAU33_06615 [Candidatus Dependentiae bacterium]|nr:hypothetical protein [Candidatus Dependentiae bacterium]
MVMQFWLGEIEYVIGGSIRQLRLVMLRSSILKCGKAVPVRLGRLEFDTLM